jgi:hypothetical protein
MSGLRFLSIVPEEIGADQDVMPGGDPRDREIATNLVSAINELQEAMDKASLAGLVVEPTFVRFANRFNEVGSDADSFVAKVEIYRKLA